jgi:hypothetical protein
MGQAVTGVLWLFSLIIPVVLHIHWFTYLWYCLNLWTGVVNNDFKESQAFFYFIY